MNAWGYKRCGSRILSIALLRGTCFHRFVLVICMSNHGNQVTVDDDCLLLMAVSRDFPALLDGTLTEHNLARTKNVPPLAKISSGQDASDSSDAGDPDVECLLRE